MICVAGYPCEPHNNPADFFLDVINGDFTATTMTKVHSSEGNRMYKSCHEAEHFCFYNHMNIVLLKYYAAYIFKLIDFWLVLSVFDPQEL